MLDFQATLVEAMQAKAPKMYRRLKRSGELQAYLEAQDKKHWDLLRELLKGEPRLPSGAVKDPVALSLAEETVLSQLLEFPEETQSEGRLEPPDDLAATSDFFAPKSWDGDIVRFARTSSGGLCVEVWRDGSWVRSSIRCVTIAEEGRRASPSELARAGVQA